MWKTKLTPITNNRCAFYSRTILLSIFLFPARWFYLLSPFVFSSIYPFCLILICFLAKDPLPLEYPALSLLEETYCFQPHGCNSPHLILGLLNPFRTPVPDCSNTVRHQPKEGSPHLYVVLHLGFKRRHDHHSKHSQLIFIYGGIWSSLPQIPCVTKYAGKQRNGSGFFMFCWPCISVYLSY